MLGEGRDKQVGGRAQALPGRIRTLFKGPSAPSVPLQKPPFTEQFPQIQNVPFW